METFSSPEAPAKKTMPVTSGIAPVDFPPTASEKIMGMLATNVLGFPESLSLFVSLGWKLVPPLIQIGFASRILYGG